MPVMSDEVRYRRAIWYDQYPPEHYEEKKEEKEDKSKEERDYHGPDDIPF